MAKKLEIKDLKATIDIFQYNPNNIKEVSKVMSFNIRYVPTNKWNSYLILVNEKFTGVKINICEIITGKRLSVREFIVSAIKLYLSGNDLKFSDQKKWIVPDRSAFGMIDKAFKSKLLNIGAFKSRDELSKYEMTNLI